MNLKNSGWQLLHRRQCEVEEKERRLAMLGSKREPAWGLEIAKPYGVSL